MEVVIPPTMDFDFNSARSSPFLGAPSTPKRFGDYYFSAPTSPRHLSQFYHDFDDFSVTTSPSSIPFQWEEKPGTPKSPKFEDDFAFDVGEESEKTAIPAEELFDQGQIRPLKPPPQLRSQTPKKSAMSNIRATLSPRTEQERGRERSSGSGRRATRSVSPYRVSKYPWEEEQQLQQQSTKYATLSSTTSTLSSSSSKGYRKWRLKDFFLFRSASEGRAADKDPLKKYTALFKKHEDVKNSSFRSIEGSNSKRRGGQQVSAHEMHYTSNRAVSEDLKKKTFLPYKQGILGRLSFNPAVHALANGFGFSRK